MRTTQRFLGAFIVLIMLLASMGNAAMAQDQGNQSDTTTQTGGGNVAPPMNNNPDPAPAPQPEPSQPPAPQPSNPPAPQPQPSAPSNGAQGGSQSGTSNSSGSRAPEGLAPAPQPQSPPSGGTGGGSGSVSVVVDLSSQSASVYRGGTFLDSTLVRTGKAGFETPTGTFYINSKYRYDDMAGNERNESWDVANVPYAMYFTNRGHALHGVYWSNAFGTPGSHGCVGLPISFAAWLYGIAPIGTPVTVQW